MGIDPVTLMIGSALLGTGASLYQGQQQKKAATDAARKAAANAKKQELAADEANNRANQRSANVGSALDAAALAARGGQSGTMLTGSQGVDNSALQLGKNTLLGQ
ncbi:MAG: hypothetical protein ACK5NE_09515 [Brachymonas sp.]